MQEFSSIHGGMFEARFQAALSEVMDDILDANKRVGDVREVTMKIRVVPTGRYSANMILEDVRMKLGKSAALPTVPIQIEMNQGAAVAYEVNSEADGHVALDFTSREN